MESAPFPKKHGMEQPLRPAPGQGRWVCPESQAQASSWTWSGHLPLHVRTPHTAWVCMRWTVRPEPQGSASLEWRSLQMGQGRSRDMMALNPGASVLIGAGDRDKAEDGKD